MRKAKLTFFRILVLLVHLYGAVHSIVWAQGVITSDGSLGTQVTQNGNIHNITGGTRPGGGGNLFHSFREFGVPTNNIANFLNDSGLPTRNILSRVTGGNPSNILGTVQTQGFENANLFLMNPAGIVFGSGATLNVGGATHFTTADYLQLSDGVQFTALPSAQDALLTVAPVAAFGFLASNPASILVNGSTESVGEGEVLSLVGGNINISGGSLQSTDGQINLVSLNSPGTVNFTGDGNLQVNATQLGRITLFDNASVNVNGESGGRIMIRGGQLMVEGAQLSANTAGLSEGGVAEVSGIGIDIEVSEDVVLDNRSLVVADVGGSRDGRNIRVLAGGNLEIRNSILRTFAIPGSVGNAGNIEVQAENVLFNINSPPQQPFEILGISSAAVGGSGDSGSINIKTNSVEMLGGFIATVISGIPTEGGGIIGGTGQAGNIELTVENDVSIIGSDTGGGSIVGNAFFGSGNAGNILILADNVTMTGNSQIQALTAFAGDAGTIQLALKGDLVLEEASSISSISDKGGTAGNIMINAKDIFLTGVENPIPDGTPSGEQTLIAAATTGEGQGGNIIIEAENVVVTNKAFLSTSTRGAGEGGDITVTAENFSLNNGASVTAESTPQNVDAGNAGDAGAISIETGSLSLSAGATINSGTRGGGKGGNIDITAKQLVVATASQILTDTGSFDVTGPVSGQGDGGTVTVTADDSVELDGGQILTRTLGAGNAGAIVVETNQLNISNGGGLFATSGIPDANMNLVAGSGSAGNITVTARESLSLSGADSFISSATGGAGNGGIISLETGRLMVADQAGIIATSGLVDSNGNFVVGQGNAGSITIEARESASISNGGLISSSTGGGVGGLVSVGAPELVLNGGSIQARTVGDAQGGSLSIQTGNLTMSNGAEMNTGSGFQNNSTGALLAGTGNGGDISVSASQSINLSTGARISTESLGEGKSGLVNLTTEGSFQVDDSTVSTSAQRATGGEIMIRAGKDVELRNNATISAESFGGGNAGNITITAPDTILLDNTIVTTEADEASGGNIKLTAKDTIQLVDSTIASSVEGDENTKGGNINLDPDFIILQNSKILAKAGEGKGGNIFLMANDAVLVDPFSEINASATEGISGSVNIQAPIQNLSGTIAPLPQDPVPVTALYGSRCVAGEGGHFSTFVDSKTDSLAPTPGKFLASPFLPLVNSSNPGAFSHAEPSSRVSETSHAVQPQVMPYFPPLLLAQSTGILSACP